MLISRHSVFHWLIALLYCTGGISAEISTANNQLATKLYSILADKTQDNFAFSPLTLSAVLSMVNAGAGGETAEEFRKALEFIQDKEEMSHDYRRILSDFQKLYSTSQLALRLYLPKGTVLKDTYKHHLADSYFQDPGFADFSVSNETEKEINNWVSNATESKIVNLISPGALAEEELSLVLVNTLHFKGSWVNQFKERDTQPSPFFYNQNKSYQVDMMFQRVDVPFAEIEELDATAIALPYRLTPANKKESRFEMIVLRPNSRTGLSELESKLATFPFSLIISQFLEKRDLYVYLPKFNIESSGLNFIDALSTLGLNSVFKNGSAELADISDTFPLYVSQIYQKINFTVDEHGSDGIKSSISFPSKSHQPPESFRLDRPFMGFVYDQERHVVVYAFRKKYTTPTPEVIYNF